MDHQQGPSGAPTLTLGALLVIHSLHPQLSVHSKAAGTAGGRCGEGRGRAETVGLAAVRAPGGLQLQTWPPTGD